MSGNETERDWMELEVERQADEAFGCGGVLFLALALCLAAWAVFACRQREEDEEIVAAYSVCEVCGLVLDEAAVRARCAGEEADYADAR